MPAKTLPRASFDTGSIDPRNRFEAWRSIIGLTHEIETTADDFHAQLTSTALGTMIVSEMTAAPQSVGRTSQRVRRDGLDHVTLHFTSSDFDVEQGDARFHVSAGTITVNTLSRPFHRSEAAEKGSVIVSLARDLVASILPEPEVFHGRQLRDGFGNLLRDHMQALARNAHLIRPAETEGVARATAQLLAATLEPTRSRIGDARAGLDAAATARCKRHVENNLSSPDLTPDSICRALGLSRSTLFRLFKSSGGISSYIRQRRLSAAKAVLIASKRPRISDVALRYGFSDVSAFSRAFRATYGMSPKDAADDDQERIDEANIFNAWMQAVSHPLLP